MHVEEVRCPSCSAPASPEEGVSTCRFCGATLAIREAPAPKRASVKAPVVLEDAGPNTIEVTKVIREHTGIGLQAAKHLIENTPCVVADWPTDQTRMVVFYCDLIRAGARAS